MNNFNYALNEGDYSLPKALTWGNCRAHFKKAINAGDLDGRVIHVLIALAEFLPILGQLASLIELAVMEIFSKNVAAPQVDYTAYLPKDVREIICSKLEDPRALVRTSKLWREAADQFCLRRVTNIFGDIFDFKKRGAAYIFTDMWGPLTLVKGKSIPIVDSHLKGGFDLNLTIIYNLLKLESPYADPEVLKTVLLRYNSSFLGANYQEVLQTVACILRALRAENRLKEIQQDPWFSNFASGLILDGGRYALGILLKDYGVPVSKVISPADLNSNIDRCIRQADPGIPVYFVEYFVHLNKLAGLDYKTYCNTDGLSLADLARRYGQFELERILLAREVPHFKKDEVQKQLEEEFCKATGLMRWDDDNSLLFVTVKGYSWERFEKVVEHYKIDLNQIAIDGYLLGIYIFNRFIKQDEQEIAEYIPHEKITPLYALCQTLSICIQMELRNWKLGHILYKIERVIALGCGLDVKIGSGKSPRNLLTEILSRPKEKQPPPEITEKIKSILDNNPKDRTTILTKDVTTLLCSKYLNSKDVIALAGTNRFWRGRLTEYCTRTITNLFGNTFNLCERGALQVFADIAGPFKKRSNQLATIFPSDVDAPMSIEMESLIHSIKNGSVDELRQNIAALKDPTELTRLKFGRRRTFRSPENLLRIAVQSRDIKKVQLLIDSGTPIGVGVNGMMDTNNGPLLEAGISQEDVLRLLLKNGALFSVYQNARIGTSDMWEDYEPQPLLYRFLEHCPFREMDQVGLRCVTLALRSWIDEKGPTAIQDDLWLANFASECIIDSSRYQLGQLLKGFGAPITIDAAKIHIKIDEGVAHAKIAYLESLNKLGYLNYQTYRNNGYTLADSALRYGQHELESHLVNDKKVPYFDNERALEDLEEDVCSLIMAYAVFRSLWLGGQLFGQKCDWNRVIEIITHYKLNIDGAQIEGNTPLFALCEKLSFFSGKKEIPEDEMSQILLTIEDIIPLGAQLDRKNEFNKSPKDLLEEILNGPNKGKLTPQLIQKIVSILGNQSNDKF